jgi:hypothetical protein
MKLKLTRGRCAPARPSPKPFIPGGVADARQVFRSMSPPERRAWAAGAVREIVLLGNLHYQDALRQLCRSHRDVRSPAITWALTRATPDPRMDHLAETSDDWWEEHISHRRDAWDVPEILCDEDPDDTCRWP